jgi:hypothetical protein
LRNVNALKSGISAARNSSPTRLGDALNLGAALMKGGQEKYRKRTVNGYSRHGYRTCRDQSFARYASIAHCIKDMAELHNGVPSRALVISIHFR